MRSELSFEETRVIGALIEKEITTPDQYPLSLNSLTLACNQKSNREPVVSFGEHQVQDILDQLMAKAMMFDDAGSGGRVARYKHRFCNTQFGDLQFSAQELGIICVLFLRGPQTPGELRTRTNRLCQFDNVQQVESVLSDLMLKRDEALVCKLEREPGKRENRYAHLFSGEVADVAAPQSSAGNCREPASPAHSSSLQEQIDELKLELEQIKQWIVSREGD